MNHRTLSKYVATFAIVLGVSVPVVAPVTAAASTPEW
jgi:hypothetical protein